MFMGIFSLKLNNEDNNAGILKCISTKKINMIKQLMKKTKLHNSSKFKKMITRWK